MQCAYRCALSYNQFRSIKIKLRTESGKGPEQALAFLFSALVCEDETHSPSFYLQKEEEEPAEAKPKQSRRLIITSSSFTAATARGSRFLSPLNISQDKLHLLI
jgi:hypothetical protein